MYFMGNIGRAEIHHLLYAEIQQGAYLLTKTLVLILTKPMIRQRKRVEWMDIRLVSIINPCARVDQTNCLMKSIQITGQGGKRVQGGELLGGSFAAQTKLVRNPQIRHRSVAAIGGDTDLFRRVAQR